MSAPSSLAWQRLSWKGIDPIVLDEAGVTREGGLLRVPYRLHDGSLFRERYFTGTGRTWWGEGEGLIPFGLETLCDPGAAADRALLIAEGESDALSLRQAFAGVTADNPIRGYHVLGLPGARSWQPEWRSIVEPFPLVYIVGDGDQAGRAMNETVKRDVPWARPVRLPDGEDARGLLQREGPAALDGFLDRADADAWLWATVRIAPSLEAIHLGWGAA